MKNVATIIVNRNLPKVTNKLYSNLKKNNPVSDFFVLESGSDKKKLSKFCTWHANSESVKKNGLRFTRAINYALYQLFLEKKFNSYEYFFFITNDSVFSNYRIISRLSKFFKENEKLAILYPCSKYWGEKKLIKNKKIMFFYHIQGNALMIRKDFITSLIDMEKPSKKNFLFDGENFRGYGLESELIAKAYSNNWAAGITNAAFVEHNETLLINNTQEIKTENFDLSLRLYIEEGKRWMKKKYGFNSKWAMQMYVKNFYDKFFEFNPELKEFKI